MAEKKSKPDGNQQFQLSKERNYCVAVVYHYDGEIKFNTFETLQDLVAFLKTLTGTNVSAIPFYGIPYGISRPAVNGGRYLICPELDPQNVPLFDSVADEVVPSDDWSMT